MAAKVPPGGRALPGLRAPGSRGSGRGGVLPQSAPVSGSGGDRSALQATLKDVAGAGGQVSVNSQPMRSGTGRRGTSKSR